MYRNGGRFGFVPGLEWVQVGGFRLFLSGVDSWAEGTKEMAPGPVGDFLKEYVRFLVFVEAKTKHTGGSSEVMEEGLILTVLKDFRNGKYPYNSVRLHIDKFEPVFFLQA